MTKKKVGLSLLVFDYDTLLLLIWLVSHPLVQSVDSKGMIRRLKRLSLVGSLLQN